MLEDVDSAEAEVSGAMSESENEYDDHDHYQDDSLMKDEDEKMTDQNTSSEGVDANGEVKKKYDPKDPSRPRRKKARRACYACQRAHLTCGDERPCQRCIKRGLADACQDGVRKKAKYLHDAPAEALRPVLGPNFAASTHSTRPSNGHRHPSHSGSEASSTVGTFFSPSNASQYPMFSSAQAPVATMPDGMPTFANAQNPVSPTFQAPNNSQMSGISVPQISAETSDFSAALFDPSNPAIFNFNFTDLNFGSQYGAMEWGMLGHMSSGAAGTPPRDNSMSQQGAGETAYASAGNFGNGVNQYEKVYDSGMVGDFLGLDQHANGLYSQGNLQHGLPHAYAIAAGPTSLQSPSTENNSPQPTSFGFEGSPTTAAYVTTPGSGHHPVQQPRPKPKAPNNITKLSHHSMLGKRQRDPSYIYDTVKEPFPYVKSFHKLIELLKTRLASAQTLKVAKSLASIRPSFISCTRTLNRQDLVFMEKSFQRALFEYEEFMHQMSSPAIICRRTGEVAGANKEFTAVTGWTKNVLLGKEPNENVNTGMGMGMGMSASSASSNGPSALATPRLRALNMDTSNKDEEPRPVFLAELMDIDSVCEFYEDYSHLAFNDSRGKVVRTCRLLKYRIQEAVDSSAGTTQEGSPQKDPRRSILSNRVAKIDGEHGISRLEKDGKLDCTYTWTIKRDTFDIPMMIVINFLPRNNSMLAV